MPSRPRPRAGTPCSCSATGIRGSPVGRSRSCGGARTSRPRPSSRFSARSPPELPVEIVIRAPVSFGFLWLVTRGVGGSTHLRSPDRRPFVAAVAVSEGPTRWSPVEPSWSGRCHCSRPQDEPAHVRRPTGTTPSGRRPADRGGSGGAGGQGGEFHGCSLRATQRHERHDRQPSPGRTQAGYSAEHRRGRNGPAALAWRARMVW